MEIRRGEHPVLHNPELVFASPGNFGHHRPLEAIDRKDGHRGGQAIQDGDQVDPIDGSTPS